MGVDPVLATLATRIAQNRKGTMYTNIHSHQGPIVHNHCLLLHVSGSGRKPESQEERHVNTERSQETSH